MIIKKKKKDIPEEIQAAPNVADVKKVQSGGLFDVLNQVTERQERRRGDRRRGYRRIEDRGLVSRAHEEAKMIKEQAAQDGFKAGMEESQAEIEQLRDAIASILNVKQEAYEYFKNDIAFIGVEVAKKILSKEVSLNSEIILEIVSNVIKEVSEEESKITIIVNPEDEEILNQNISNNLTFNSKRTTISIESKNDIERGSCKVITQSGQIDATFATQLDVIRKAFQEGL